jgi:hypothetical protein
MRPEKYILDERGEPKIELDLHEWAAWFETGERRIAQTISADGSVRVSTVFLGLDHNWTGDFPVLWETMVFGGALDQEQERCGGSREQAEAMHTKMVERVQTAIR